MVEKVYFSELSQVITLKFEVKTEFVSVFAGDKYHISSS